MKVIDHSFADPTPFVAPAHDAGALVICQVPALAAAVQAAAAGVDVVTAQGTEAGGHTGHVSTLALVPAVVSAVAPVPVIAAGSSWPADVSGRAIRDEFSDRWQGHEHELRDLVARDGPQHERTAPGAPGRAFWAGEAAGFVTRREAAGAVLVSLARDAAVVLATRSGKLIGRSSPVDTA